MNTIVTLFWGALFSLPIFLTNLIYDSEFAFYAICTHIGVVVFLILNMFASILFKGLGTARTPFMVVILSFVATSVLVYQFAALYYPNGLTPPVESSKVSFFDAFYFSIVTWTTLGYGDFQPKADSRSIVMVEVVLGYIIMALQIAVFVKMMEREKSD